MFMSELRVGLAEVTPQLTISSIYINYCLHYSSATLPNTHDKGENILISVNLNILFAFWGKWDDRMKIKSSKLVCFITQKINH